MRQGREKGKFICEKPSLLVNEAAFKWIMVNYKYRTVFKALHCAPPDAPSEIIATCVSLDSVVLPHTGLPHCDDAPDFLICCASRKGFMLALTSLVFFSGMSCQFLPSYSQKQ